MNIMQQRGIIDHLDETVNHPMSGYYFKRKSVWNNPFFEVSRDDLNLQPYQHYLRLGVPGSACFVAVVLLERRRFHLQQ